MTETNYREWDVPEFLYSAPGAGELLKEMKKRAWSLADQFDTNRFEYEDAMKEAQSQRQAKDTAAKEEFDQFIVQSLKKIGSLHVAAAQKEEEEAAARRREVQAYYAAFTNGDARVQEEERPVSPPLLALPATPPRPVIPANGGHSDDAVDSEEGELEGEPEDQSDAMDEGDEENSQGASDEEYQADQDGSNEGEPVDPDCVESIKKRLRSSSALGSSKRRKAKENPEWKVGDTLWITGKPEHLLERVRWADRRGYVFVCFNVVMHRSEDLHPSIFVVDEFDFARQALVLKQLSDHDPCNCTAPVYQLRPQDRAWSAAEISHGIPCVVAQIWPRDE